MLNDKYNPQILSWIKKMFAHSKNKHWYETYWAFDIHGTIIKSDYRKGTKRDLSQTPSVKYYPFAKESLQLLSKRKDIVMILFTSSYPEEIEYYNNIFKKDSILFKYINENPEISESKGAFGYYQKKLYFNVFFDDKSGFNPKKDWQPIYNYIKNTKYKPNEKWNIRFKEKYHKE